MDLLRAVDQEELAALRHRLGPDAPVQEAWLPVADPFLERNHQRLLKDGRRAEICYIMHRGDPADGVLLHHKSIYPAPAYRLPTGGILPGSSAWENLVKEIKEETGMVVAAEANPDGVAQVQAFLGVVAYAFQHAAQGMVEFATYHFLVQIPADAQPRAEDPDEQIDGWRWLPAGELRAQADALEHLGATAPDWADWGRFRALSHHFVADRLAERR